MADKKGKKVMEGQVTKIEEKEVDFGDIELKIQKPTLNSDKTISINGNFGEVKANIQKVVDRYKNTQLTPENFAYVKTLKKQFVTLRTGVERERKEYVKVYITPAKDLIDAMCKELLATIDEGEKALGDQLDAYDQKRKDELTVILKDYVDEFTEKYALREEYASQIQLIDKYYNLTQDEADSVADIENQAKELAKKQAEYDAGVKLIKSECEEAGLLSDTYIRELQYKSAMEIMLEIKQDKKANDELKAKVEGGEKVTVGEPLSEELKRATSFEDMEETVRTRILRVTYKPEQAKLMSEFFKKNDIKYEFIKQ